MPSRPTALDALGDLRRRATEDAERALAEASARRESARSVHRERVNEKRMLEASIRQQRGAVRESLQGGGLRGIDLVQRADHAEALQARVRAARARTRVAERELLEAARIVEARRTALVEALRDRHVVEGRREQQRLAKELLDEQRGEEADEEAHAAGRRLGGSL